MNKEEEEAFVVKKIEEEDKWKKNKEGKTTNNSRILSLKTNPLIIFSNSKKQRLTGFLILKIQFYAEL